MPWDMIRHFCSVLAPRVKCRKPYRKTQRPVLEALEDRLAPATITWTVDTSGNWNDPAKWSTGSVPGPNDTAVINRSVAVTVTVNSTQSVGGLQVGAQEKVALSGGANLTLSGTLTNNGTVELDPAADYAHFQFNGNTTLAGTGQLVMDAGGTRAAGGAYYALVEPGSSGGTLTVAAGQTVRGTGYLLAVINQGLVQADVSGQYIVFEDSAVNSGTVKAVNGANLEVYQTTLNNTGGTVLLDGGTLYSNAGTITGGVLTFTHGATLQGTGTLADVTVPAGSNLHYLGASNGGSFIVTGTITNNGTIELEPKTNYVTLTANGNVTFTGTWQVQADAGGSISGGGTNASFFAVGSSGDTLTNAAGQTMRAMNGAFFSIGYDLGGGPGGGTVVNDGLMIGDGGTLGLSAATLKNAATLKAVNGGAVHIDRNPLNNSGGQILVDGGMLTGNGIFAINGGLLDLRNGSTLQGTATLQNVTNAADSDMRIPGGTGMTLLVSGTLTNDGIITVPSGTVTLTGGTLDNSGTVQVDSGTLNVASSVKQVAGNTLTGGTWSVLAGAALNLGNASISINKAIVTLSGTGSTFAAINNLASNAGSFSILAGHSFTTVGDFSNTGNLTIGAGSTLTVKGNYSQSAAASLTVEVGGPSSSGAFGQLSASGTATLDGTLNINLTGLGIHKGDSFPIMKFSSHQGAFATITGLTAGRTQVLSVAQNASNVTVNVLQNTATLVVSSVTFVPATDVPGQAVTVTYTVKNVENTATTVSSWWDSIYLDPGTTITPGSKLIGRVQHTGIVDALGSYKATQTFTLPGDIPGNYHILVITDSRGLVPDFNRTQDLGVSSSLIAVDIPALTPNTTTNGTLDNGQYQYYRVDLPAEAVVRVTAAFGAAAAAELYVRYQDVPDQAAYDQYAFAPAKTQEQILLTGTQFGTYYILLHGREGAGSG